MAAPPSTGVSDERSRAQVTPSARRVRLAAALVVAALAACAIAGAVIATYAQHVLLDTAAFTQRAAGLTAEAQVRSDVAVLITDTVFDSVDLEDRFGAVLESAPASLAEGLAGAASEEARSIVAEAVKRFMASPEFQAAWKEAVHRAHTDLMAALRDKNGEVFEMDAHALTVDLGAMVNEVQQRLVADGIVPAADLPALDVEVVLIEGEQVAQLQRNLVRLELAATWLPWAGMALVALTLVLAPSRRQAALAIGAFGTAAAVFGLAALGRGRASFTERSQDDALAQVVFDAFTGDLVRIFQVMAAAAVLLAVGAARKIVTEGSGRS